MKKPRVIVFTDADNTLWDTDAVYATAQKGLLSEVEVVTGLSGPSEGRLEFVREFDQEIAAKHHKGLRYQPAFLAQAIALGLNSVDPSTAARIVLHGDTNRWVLSPSDAKQIEQNFFAALNTTPILRPGVKEGLISLRKGGCTIIVVTEGSKEKCCDLLEKYDLASQIERVIESPKHQDLYRRVCRLGGGADLAFMIGDQLDRDIGPAAEAGLKTIYFPGGFRPKWHPAASEVQPDTVVSSFEGAAQSVFQTVNELVA